MDPLLKWVGSKRWHVADVRKLYDGKRRIVEPFCGGGAISFGLEPSRALLNDANPHLINFYRWVQRGFLWTFELASSEADYYDYRTWLNRLIRERRCNTADGAQLFYYLMHHGYNGLCRFNKSGEFNVPFRPGRTAPEQDWPAVRKVIAGWEFTCDDFADVLLEPDDFVYVDPPYDGTFGDYTEGGWSFDQFEVLATLLRAHPGPVVIMNSGTDRVRQLLRGLDYRIDMVQSGQRMQQSQGRTDVVPEVMACNFRA